MFFNHYDALDPSKPAFTAVPDISFQAFPVVSTSGAVVAAADMGSFVNGSFSNVLDGKAEIVVGTGGGTTPTVSVFDVSGGAALRMQSFFPFMASHPSYRGGVWLDVARIDADTIPDVIVGMGTNGASRIEVWAWSTSEVSFSLLGAIPDAFTGPSKNAPVRVAAMDTDGNGISETIYAVQGPIGTTGEVHRFEITSTSPFAYQPEDPLSGFPGPWFIATPKAMPSGSVPQPEPIVAPPIAVWTNRSNPYDVNNEGRDHPLGRVGNHQLYQHEPG